MLLNIGIIGLGTVGSGVIETIEKNRRIFFKKFNIDIKIIGISARNKNKKRSFDIKKYKWYKNPIELVENSELNLIVELIGGSSGLALEIATKTLKNKKHLVTANKALIAIHGNRLSKIADRYGVNLNFEASVAGGIPIISMIKSSLLADNITNIYGILNGTCNYILSKMSDNSISFENALKNAQIAGFAELNPYDDISGTDASYKLLILSNLVFGTKVNIKSIYREGISNIDSLDLEMADKLGYNLKLLSITNFKNKNMLLRVHPCLIKKESIIAKVKDELNTVVIEGDTVDKIVIVGKGAGRKPTSSAVISDILNLTKFKFRDLSSVNNRENFKIIKIENRKGKFYVRMQVLDRPGVLADITKCFKNKKISISSMFQLEKNNLGYVQLIFVTHTTLEKNLLLVIKKIEKLAKVKTKVNFIRIENNI